MHAWLIGQGPGLGIVAAKAALIYVVAVLGLRTSQRRTLAQWTAIDFAAAVAVGAIIGRTSTASTQSVAVGAVALVTLMVAHRLVMICRFDRRFAKLVDHRVRVLVDHGELRRDQMRLCGLTENDVYAQLRERGVRELSDVQYVLYETKGDLTIVSADEPGPESSQLIASGLESAAGFKREA
jgi:uncharacterized membrane protein YcaP (DUF421 family)